MRDPSRTAAAGSSSIDALLAWYFVAVWGAGYIATRIGLQYAAPFTFLSPEVLFRASLPDPDRALVQDALAADPDGAGAPGAADAPR
jgi:hypothetical protein